jgi:hypothetical protein
VAPFLSVFLVYWVPGVIGSLASANLDAKYIVTGASNSVCGLLGARLLPGICNAVDNAVRHRSHGLADAALASLPLCKSVLEPIHMHGVRKLAARVDVNAPS